MALQTTLGPRNVPGATFDVISSHTGDASYPAGGYIVTPQTFGFNILKSLGLWAITSIGDWAVVIEPTLNPDGSIASAALRAVVTSTGVEVATATSVAGLTFNLRASGV